MNIKRQKYGIGKQDFPDMIQQDFVYVDKTQYIIKLLEGAGYYFLSRPRRFGKSLFLSTLEQFFLGKKELFKNLAIENYQWNWEARPVIRMSLAQGSFTEQDGLKSRLNQILFNIEEDFGFTPRFEKLSERFSDLITRINKTTNQKVVILIDEYEKPLLDSYDTPVFETNRDDLANFYSVFKDNLDKIEFLFITGVTRFGKLNIFSGLNNLRDISLDTDFSAICGITIEEIQDYFDGGISLFAKKHSISESEVKALLKKYYDGYHFSEDLQDIYNPWSLLNCLQSGRLTSDWFATGSPGYLLKILRKKDYDLKGLLGSTVNENKLKGSGVDIMDPTSLLYQSGYLTIKQYDLKENLYSIGLPNFEVRTALFESLIPFYLGKDKELDPDRILKLFRYIENGEATELMEWLAAYFSKISIYSKIHFERDFQVIVLGIFLLIKDFKDIHCEYAMSSGRTDLVVEAKNYVYVFEFKIGENAEKALNQIDFKGYDIPWRADGRQVFRIGAAFSVKNNGILRYKIDKN